MYDVYSCGFDGVIVRPKRVHKEIIVIFAKGLLVTEATGMPGKIFQSAGPDRGEGVGGG